MKRSVELNERELKRLIAKALGMEGADVRFHVAACRDDLDRPTGDQYVSCWVTSETELPARDEQWIDAIVAQCRD